MNKTHHQSYQYDVTLHIQYYRHPSRQYHSFLVVVCHRVRGVLSVVVSVFLYLAAAGFHGSHHLW